MRENPKPILIVEDSATQAQKLQVMLSQNGFRVVVAANGMDALEKMLRENYCMVVSDVMMPIMDGYTLCREIKAAKKLKEVPVVLLTTLSNPQDIIKGLNCGADSFIRKPFDETYLVSRVNYVLTAKELRKTEKSQMGVEVFIGGKKHFISSERQQILDLLIATYEQGIQIKDELFVKQKELAELSQLLEQKVKERTAQLTKEMEERKSIEEQLRQSQKMEAIGRLAGGVAHDFNNLLTAINGNAELLLLKKSSPQCRHELEEIKKAAERAAKLTRQLLAFSRKQVLQPKVLDLNKVVEEMEQLLRRLVSENIEFHTQLSSETKPVFADPALLEQVLLNLVVNARDAMPHGGKIIIETDDAFLDENYCRDHLNSKPGHYVMLAVSDTGIGMSRETLSHIFEPFFTTKEQGTGLGLAMVYGNVKQSNGNIFVYSEEGKGTTFKIYLSKAEQPLDSIEKKTPPAGKITGTETILIAEDNEMVRDLAYELLKMHGYKILTAENGQKALELIKANNQPIDLLITDVIMPKLGGRDLEKEIKLLQKEIKIIFISGYTSNAIAKNGILDPQIHFIAKPFSAVDFLCKVREVLDEKA